MSSPAERVEALITELQTLERWWQACASEVCDPHTLHYSRDTKQRVQSEALPILRQIELRREVLYVELRTTMAAALGLKPGGLNK